tara:strand:- start:159916 stop:161082 length:1167 start_codon:yes stop_codon:yes gene_type:complete
MATQTGPSQSSFTSISVPVLLACLVLSLLVHLFTVGGFASYAKALEGSGLEAPENISIPDMPVPPQPEEDPLRLGREDAKSASITWLGVLENPIEGEAPEFEVEQAELAINTGVQDITQPTPTPSTPVVETIPDPQSIPEQTPEPVTEPEPVQSQDPVEQPEQTTPIEPIEIEPMPEPVIEITDSTTIDPEPQPEPIEEPVPVEPAPVEPAPDVPAEESTESQEQQPEPTPAATRDSEPTQPEQPTPTSVTEQGKSGEEDDRESVASKIKRAETHDVSALNRPLSSAGLEIKPVEPRYPATVRFTQLPRNPILIIRFNAQGRVVFVDFIRDEEKKKVYDTGSRAVDEPLLSAVYKWRASGEPLKKLDPDDPKSFIEISMKILFRDEKD